jgi:hypothetical protein
MFIVNNFNLKIIIKKIKFGLFIGETQKMAYLIIIGKNQEIRAQCDLIKSDIKTRTEGKSLYILSSTYKTTHLMSSLTK